MKRTTMPDLTQGRIAEQSPIQQALLKPAALLLALLDAGLAVALVVLVMLNGEHLHDAVSSLVEIPPSLSFALVGTLILMRRPHHVVGWLLLGIGLPLVLEQTAIQYATYTLVTRPGALPAGPLAAWISTGIWGAGYAAIVLLVLLFPTGAPPPRAGAG